ncbi:MAG: glycoside hydrolase family 3 N-terminal domain-containing protein, partial [Ignisphaera sp.]
MSAYHEIDGVPCHANRELLTDILRQTWGFRGIVVSDYGAIMQLSTIHRVARDCIEAFRIALEAGVDVNFPDVICFNELVEAVK